ncbi:MAG: hypothetical protein RBR69_03560, partial [Candidatus Cloacimonadaceae bacterium]|nr:hypothetical protein [Candidatus Cloacimonadaceae bacterium]
GWKRRAFAKPCRRDAYNPVVIRYFERELAGFDAARIKQDCEGLGGKGGLLQSPVGETPTIQ